MSWNSSEPVSYTHLDVYKRQVLELLIQVEDDFGKSCIINDAYAYRDINEPFMSDERSGGEPAWVEYLMWERAKDDWMPMLLKYKYYQDDKNDKEVERRIKERRGKS